MIIFKNGEFYGGDLMDIISVDWNDAPDSDTWWDCGLYSEVTVLTIPKGAGKIRLFEVWAENLEFIPRQSEGSDEHHAMFWESAETYVFGCFDSALQYMKIYSGDFEEEVRGFLANIQEELLYNDARTKFECTCDLPEEINADFMNDLTQFVQEHPAPMEQVLASMKLYMLNFYKTELENTGRHS